MTLGNRQDPFSAFNFLVEIEGLTVGGFSEVSGLQAEVEVQDYREGGLNSYTHRLAGPVRYTSNLLLKRGLADIDSLGEWYQDAIEGRIRRRNGSIVLLDKQGSEARRWNFLDAYPVKWTGPELRAINGAVAVETLELAYHGLQRDGIRFGRLGI